MSAAEIINEKQRYILTFFLFIMNLACGFSLAMIGPIMANIYQEHHLRLYQGGFLLAAQSLGGVVALITGAILIDKISKIEFVLFLFIAFALVLIFVGLSIDYYTLILIFFLLGLSTKGLEAAGSALVADIHPGKQGTYLALLHACFAVGVFLGPLYAQILLHSQIAWKSLFLVCGSLCIVFIVFFYFFKDKKQLIALNNISAPGRIKEVMRNPTLWLLSLIMFLYCGQMFGLLNLFPKFLETEAGAQPRVAGLTPSAFWMGVILSRLLAAKRVKICQPKVLIHWGCLLSGVLLAVGILSKMLWLTFVMVGLAGFFAGAVIPLVVTMGCSWFPENTGTVSSMLFLAGSLAAIVFPLFIEMIAEYANFYFGISIIALGLILISVSIKWFPALNNER